MEEMVGRGTPLKADRGAAGALVEITTPAIPETTVAMGQILEPIPLELVVAAAVAEVVTVPKTPVMVGQEAPMGEEEGVLRVR